MILFEIGQKWDSSKLRGEVIEIAEGGKSGVVAITDDAPHAVSGRRICLCPDRQRL